MLEILRLPLLAALIAWALSWGGPGEHPSAPTPSASTADSASRADPLPFWGRVDCDLDGRPPQRSGQTRVRSSDEGDHSSFRRLTVFDGDQHFGERCELGLNARTGPVTFYREGERDITHLSLRLPPSFPLAASRWQVVMQMKQTQPADNAGGTPVISLNAFNGRWRLYHSTAGPTAIDREIWSAPARTGVWTRFTFQALYSQDPERGELQVLVDLNEDGDTRDPKERSPTFILNTLKRETGAAGSGLEPGASIPSHLRVGIYHDPRIGCPPPDGCSIEVDGVRVDEAGQSEPGG